jgi:hypothetical protein
MPKSSLGECIASFLTGEGHILVPLEAYFDGSSNGQPSLLTLAGFAAQDSIWIEFDKKWREILADSNKRPAAKYLHMREANSLEGEFCPRNGWNAKKVDSLITDLLLYLQTVDKERFRMAACTVDLTAREKLRYEGLPVPEAVEICNQWCPQTFLAWYFVKYPGIVSTLHFFFDKGEPFEDSFRQTWKRETAKVLVPGANDMTWSLIQTIASTDAKCKPGLQAADLLAWATNRLTAGVGHTYKSLLTIMKSVIPWYHQFCDEAKMRELYPK